MSRKFLPKKSIITGKVPTASDLAHGEIAINYADRILYGRHPGDGSIVNLTGAQLNHSHEISDVNGLQSSLDDKISDSPEDGNKYARKDGDWVEIELFTSADFDSNFSGKSTSDLSEGSNLYFTTARVRDSISASGDLDYNSSTGVFSFTETYSTASDIKTAYESNANTNAFTDAEKSKLDGIEAGAQVNVGTDLGQSRNTTSYTITSSTGNNTSLLAATTSNAGVMSASDKSKLDGIESGAQVNTVDSVAGKTGTVTLSTSDISEGSNLYFTDARARSAIKSDPDWNASNWDTAYSWGDHATAGYAQDSDISTVGKTGNYNDLTNKPDLSVLEEVFVFGELNDFPSTGESDKVYIAEDTGYMYRWNGSGYTQLTDQTAIWGNISGSLSNQSDLQSALDGKASTSHSHTSGDLPSDIMYEGDDISLLDNDVGYITSSQAPVQSVNSKTGTVTLSTSDISEGSNQYFTTARARNSVSASGDLDYNSSTGVFSFTETYSSASDIKSAYESNSNTNVFTDAEKSKLSGIESGAQVNVGTDLGSSGTGGTRTITSSTGSNTSITYTAADLGLGDVPNLDFRDYGLGDVDGSSITLSDSSSQTTGFYSNSSTEGIIIGRTSNGNNFLFGVDRASSSTPNKVFVNHTWSDTWQGETELLHEGHVNDGLSFSGGNLNVDSSVVRTSRTISTSGIATGGGNLGSNVTITVPGTNLAQGGSGNSRTITSSTGSDVTISTATTSNAGFMSTGDKSKLDGIESGAQVNVGTDLSVSSGTTSGPTVNSSTGDNVTLPSASATASGVVTTGNQTFAGTKTFNSTISGSISGNSATATALQNSRTINGTSFNGTSNITTSSWGTSRDITIGSTTKSVNGSSDVSWSLSDLGVNNSTLTLATSGIASGGQTWTANQGSNATFTVSVPGTNLAMGGSGNSRTITSSTGDNVSVPVATTSNAGFMSSGDKSKLDGIESGAEVNVGTDLGSSGTGSTRTITSSTGSNTSITYTAADVGAVPAGRILTGGDGINSIGNLTSNRTISVDNTVVRTSGSQTIGGEKTFTDDTTVEGLTIEDMGSVASRVGFVLKRDSAEYRMHMSHSRLYIEQADGDQGSGIVIGTNNNIGIGIDGDPSEKLEVDGNVRVDGSFFATSKSFLIEHPTKQGMKLRYGSLESPYHGVRLTGESVLTEKTCRVQLPEYIHGLCKQEGAQVQLTNIRHGKVLWVENIDVSQDYFEVSCERDQEDDKEYKFYWSFTAIRKDVEDMQVEVE